MWAALILWDSIITFLGCLSDLTGLCGYIPFTHCLTKYNCVLPYSFQRYCFQIPDSRQFWFENYYMYSYMISYCNNFAKVMFLLPKTPAIHAVIIDLTSHMSFTASETASLYMFHRNKNQSLSWTIDLSYYYMWLNQVIKAIPVLEGWIFCCRWSL